LIHELVISLPAGAGYGLPTGYFLLQGWGIVTQRSPLGKRCGLRRGVRGWVFTMALTAGPAVFLFHPPFVRRVVLPFMQAIGAL
jgi:alginate O-acetyltransferase complex protein AlgI